MRYGCIGGVATLTLLLLLLYVLFLIPQCQVGLFPETSCESGSARPHTTLHSRNHRLWSTRSWQSHVSSYQRFFPTSLLRNDSNVLCVFASPGHVAAALASLGVRRVTAVEIVPSPPLVVRADPLNLPLSFRGAFDLAFTAQVAGALYPGRVAAEMERAVRPGGACVVAVEECGPDGVAALAGLFGKSELVGAVNASLGGSRVTRIVLRKN